ncbi:MAG: hypothetical protein HY864_08080 [Chloroflexi bacterium]|nr:hypothetical protein [Chloroflexota bacterium]
MTFIPESDHKRASLTLYHVVALNTDSMLGRTINKTGAAQILASLLQIDRRAPMSWLRGDFNKHPLSRENFLRFIREYRTKSGLENISDITALAICIYGADYKRAIELLDPADREAEIEDLIVSIPGEKEVVEEICGLLGSNPEAIEIALGTVATYQWADNDILKNLKGCPEVVEFGVSKIIRVVVSQFSEDMRERFSKLGGLPELAFYNLDSFEALWEKTGDYLTETTALFEKLNLIWLVQENEWKINPQILDTAYHYLKIFPKNIQHHTEYWWHRVLDKPEYFETCRSRLISRGTQLAGKLQINESFLAHLNGWFWAGMDSDWECMLSFSQYMNQNDFVFAQFLLMRRKRDLLFGLLISLGLGTVSVINQPPMLKGCGIGTGIYAFFRVLVDLHQCDTAWANLWDTLMERARSAKE